MVDVWREVAVIEANFTVGRPYWRQVSPLSEKKLLKKGTQRECTEREISNYLKDTSVNIRILPLGLCLSGLPR